MVMRTFRARGRARSQPLRMLRALTVPIAVAISCCPAAASGASTRLRSTATATTSAYLAGPSTSALPSPNKSSWTVTASKNPGSSTDDLLGVSCTNATFCMAVGAYSNSALLDDQGTLVERWSGRSWSVAANHDKTLVEKTG